MAVEICKRCGILLTVVGGLFLRLWSRHRLNTIVSAAFSSIAFAANSYCCMTSGSPLRHRKDTFLTRNFLKLQIDFSF